MAGWSAQHNGRVRKPHFFKVLLEDFNHRLKIPPKFMKHIAKETSQRAILQGPNGRSWQVELSKTRMGNFLSAGWSNFVKDHCLKEYEFLLFRYDGNMQFHVIIFDTSACERDDLFEMKIPKKFAFEGKKKRGRPRKCSLDANCTLQHQSKQLHGPVPNTFHQKSYGYNARLSVEVSRRHPVTAEDRSKAEEAANSFQSPFPYTIIRMSKYHAYSSHMVRLQTCFSRAHLPRIRTSMVLRDPSGKAWPISYIPNEERDRLSKGWTAFARGNNIEEGDFCAFELTGELELRVHIFRVAHETSNNCSNSPTAVV